MALGETCALPFTLRACPSEGCMLTEVASLVVQERVVVPPEEIVVGAAWNEEITGWLICANAAQNHIGSRRPLSIV